MGLNIVDILERFVLKGITWSIVDRREIEYACSCSRERFANALRMLGKAELQEMVDGIKPICHYCNTEYVFSHNDMIDIIKQL